MSERGLQAQQRRRARVWKYDPRKRSRIGLGVGFASMIDVVFLLLMYFLLTMDFREPERAIAVLAPADAASADPFAFPVEPIGVRVGVDLVTASIEGTQIARGASAGELASALEDSMGVSILGDEDVEIEVDPGVSWARVHAVMDALADAGFASVRLVENQP